MPEDRTSSNVTAGFTLLELSIVLAIIAMIVGGILVGRDLLKAAQLRQVITQVASYNSAVHAFQTKYGCLPGDCDNITSFFPAFGNCAGQSGMSSNLQQVCNGNGDGKIMGQPLNFGSIGANFPALAESMSFWQHLDLAGLIPGNYVPTGAGVVQLASINTPTTYQGGLVGIIYTTGLFGALASQTDNRHIFMLGMLNSLVPWGRLFSANDAFYIDSKMDDGLPYTGTVTGSWDHWGDYCGQSMSGNNLYTQINPDMVSNSWNTPTYAGCTLYINADF